MDEQGKRVAWVELYLDLVFVLAVGQLAHLIVAEPEMRSVWIALGLFVTLWWTWVGFAVLYNRRGTDAPLQRLLFLAGSVPAGVAAVAIAPASTGDSTVFALSLAVTRLLLATSYAIGPERDALRTQRVAHACIGSGALFLVSIWVPEPWRYVLWAVAILGESGAMLDDDRRRARRARAEVRPGGRGRGRDLTAYAPEDPADALDASHFAERFGLFLIILLGEVVVEAGQSSVAEHVHDVGGWGALVAAMVVAGGLWWVYFDSAVEINRRVLQLSGGSPTVARAIFAVGHMLPAFALLVTAAGLGLLLEAEPPDVAYHVAATGIGIYLASSRAFLIASHGLSRVARILLLIATFQLWRFKEVLEPRGYVWLLAGWVVMCAVLTTRTPPDAATQEEIDRYLHPDRSEELTR